jgi:uncharacterized protein with NRDE domain
VCVLIIGVHWRDELPLVVAANRDEAYARAATAPAAGHVGAMRVLCPRDLQAGGTWEGTNAAGLVAVITNRPDGDFDPARRSRGLLCLETLGVPDAGTAAERLEAALHQERYNSFNLLVADPAGAFLATWNGALHMRWLEAGTYVLSNRHDLGELSLPELDGIERRGHELRGGLLGILASHVPRSGDGFRICKHGDTYGTVSASLIYRRRDGSTLLEHACGPPCSAGFALHRLAERG